MALQLSLDELQAQTIDHLCLGELRVGEAKLKACEEVRRRPWASISECGLPAP